MHQGVALINISTYVDPLAKHTLSPSELKLMMQAEQRDEAFLAFRNPGGRLDLFSLEERRDTATLGRRTEMDLAITWDAEVSGLHAELRRIGGEWAIVDDGLSTNGTFVNEQRVLTRQRLRDGDRVRVGRSVLVFKSGLQLPPQRTVAASRAPLHEPLSTMQRRVLVALCRPYRDGADFAGPATNQQIADELFLTVDTVKTHLRGLFAKLELASLPQNQKRTRLAECALRFGLISQHELE